MSQELARYDADGTEVVLTHDDVVNVICGNPQVTPKEVRLFVELCRARKLNPFAKEAYLIKYGDHPATMVVGKDVFTRRAQKNPRFRGMEAGVFVVRPDGQGKSREGSMVLPGEQCVGAWCKVHVDGYDVPVYDSVAFDEYAGRKRDGSLNGQWAKMPGTMIRKVAVVHALREAFPDDFGGLYDAAEMGVEPVEAETVAIEDAPEPSARDVAEKCVREWAERSRFDPDRAWADVDVPQDADDEWFRNLARMYAAA